ncbi:transposase [Candidatus Pacearchaeota archaeon]|nr:transposase [Candidatus Pacearchaeota archaeon]
MLSQKVSGTSAGMWLLVPELLRLGAWDLLKAWTGSTDIDFEPRIALQVVNESAMCINRVRKKSSLSHQGFQLANGMGRLVTDEQVHLLLNGHTMQQAEELLVNLGHQRKLSGHYPGDVIAIDPHRIISKSKRIMAEKKKEPSAPSQKMLQTFFSVCSETGQPIMATMASTGMPTTKITKKLISATDQIIRTDALLVADKEHFTNELLTTIKKQHSRLDVLVPALITKKVDAMIKKLKYTPLWTGYAIAETAFSFNGNSETFRLIAQREGEDNKDYSYGAFITTSNNPAQELITKDYDKRWSVEEFFRFENDMGINRASTLNLNIRYGKLALAMMAQAATYQLRTSLKDEYKKWDAKHLANEILAWSDGDIRVEGDTIVVTFYNAPAHLNVDDYINLPDLLLKENINPKIPWLYNFKLNFRFK